MLKRVTFNKYQMLKLMYNNIKVIAASDTDTVILIQR